jgi:hypothetical protein
MTRKRCVVSFFRTVDGNYRRLVIPMRSAALAFLAEAVIGDRPRENRTDASSVIFPVDFPTFDSISSRFSYQTDAREV